MECWVPIAVTICLLLNIANCRNIPYYDLDDDRYTEIRNILDQHISSHQILPQVPHPREVRRWGVNIPLGQVSGVSVDPDGNPVILHRGKREWHKNLFNSTEHFQSETPIEDDVVVTVDQKSGGVIKSWGGGRFFLPHGIFVDSEGNVWITDVAMHQVFKFSSDSEEPSLTLGERFVPGNDAKHFCKPSSVVVSSTGDIFVADGYCNARILHFDSDGIPMGQFGHLGGSHEDSGLRVPHGLALSEDRNLLCIADRDNGRVTCINPGLKDHRHFGQVAFNIVEPNRFRVFDIAFLGETLVGVSGSEVEGMATGFTLDMREAFVDQWAPIQGFRNPHSITTTKNGDAIYITETGPNRVWKFVQESPKDLY